MTLRSMDTFGESTTLGYLDSTKLVEGNTYKCLAYVVNSNSGITKKESGFFTFYLKSVDNTILTAQLFNVTNFVQSGLTAKYLVHKPVVASFTAQIFHGRWSLILEEIAIWEGDFDKSLFIGKLHTDTSAIEEACRKTGVNLNYRAWEESSFAELADGNSGAFANLAITTLKHLTSYDNLWGVSAKDLCEVALYTLFVLHEYYTFRERFAIVADSDLLNLLNATASKASSSTNKIAILDSCKCILDLGKSPRYLQSIIVNKIIRDIIEDMRLIYLHKSMPMGAATYVGNNTEMVKI